MPDPLTAGGERRCDLIFAPVPLEPVPLDEDDLYDLPSDTRPAVKVVNVISRFLAVAVFVLAPLPLGSTDFVWICIWSVLLSISLVTADLERISIEDFHLMVPMLLSLAVVVAVIMLQTWPNPPIGTSAPAWTSLQELLGIPASRRVSMTATGPWLALGYSLLFCLAFTRAILLGADERFARQLLWILAWTGCAYALYGIASEISDPNSQLLRRKEAYLGFATGTFVNRNTAATFWGSCALLFLLPLLRYIHRRDRPPLPPNTKPFELFEHYLSSPAAMIGGFLICTVATAMTGSRAGLLLSICAFLMAGALYLAPLRLGHFRRWGLLAGAAAVGLLLFQFVGGAVIGRIVSFGLVDEQRWGAYLVSLALIKEHPLLGVGFGSFETAFTAYRTLELGSLGIWDRAHSTPLELAAELGLPAAAAIATTAGWYVYQLVSGSLRRRRNRYIPIIGASVAALGIAHSSVDFSLQIPGFGVFFAAITGCALGQCKPSSLRKNGGGFTDSEL